MLYDDRRRSCCCARRSRPYPVMARVVNVGLCHLADERSREMGHRSETERSGGGELNVSCMSPMSYEFQTHDPPRPLLRPSGSCVSVVTLRNALSDRPCFTNSCTMASTQTSCTRVGLRYTGVRAEANFDTDVQTWHDVLHRRLPSSAWTAP